MIPDLQIRRADGADLDAMAAAHRDSIRTLGPAYYPPQAVEDWAEPVSADLYRNAMTQGEVFFVATGSVDGRRIVLGFSSDYPIEGTTHGLSVYVRGAAARAGVGSALLTHAETHALRGGATMIQIEASLAGVEFYRAHGYEERGRGAVQLSTGRSIAHVFMRKRL